MVKTLRFLFVSMMVMLGMSVHAGTIVFGDLGLENGVQYSDPFDGGDFTVKFTGGGNDGKYYTTGSGIRVYGGGSMVIAAKEGTLKKIVITYDGTNKPTTDDVVSVGTYDNATGTWTGDAAEVTFTRPSGSGHWRVKKIAVGDDAEGPVKPTEGQTPETALTVARALEIIAGLDNGKSTDFTYYVKGRVNAITNKSKTISFTMYDKDNETNLLTVYSAKGLENKDIVDQSFMEDGDDVVVVGVLQKYVKDDVVTPEVSSGYVYSVNGNTQAEEVVEPTIEGGKTPETAISVKTAVDAIATMKDGQTTKDSFYVAGIVKSITEISTANGNATFVMTDNSGSELVVYRVKGLEKKNITEENLLKENDNVIVYSKLQKYVKDDTTTPELTSGYIYSINGKTEAEVKPIVLEGEGTMEKPYTVGDMLQLPSEKDKAEGQEMVWVKGFIVGALNSSGNAFDAEAVSNLALAATADETEATKCTPIQLPIGDIRTALNVIDNPSNKGKEVMIQGYLLKYMGRSGLKNISYFILDGQQYTTGITVMKAEKANNAIFNLNGQRLMKAQKGLNIIGSKKVMVK